MAGETKKRKKIDIEKSDLDAIVDAIAKATPEHGEGLLNAFLEKYGEVFEEIAKEQSTGYFAAVQKTLSKPEYRDLTFAQLFVLDKDGKCIYDKVEQEAQELFLSEKKTAVKTSSKKPEKAEYPLDKVNRNLWFLENALTTDSNGQLTINFDLGSDKKGAAATALVSLDFDEFEKHGVTLSKELTSYDKRVMIAFNSLFHESENGCFTVRQIYAAMGNQRTAGARDLKKINDSLTKMGYGHISIDNEPESKVFKSKPHYKYDASILPFERVTAVINGQEVDGAIHAFREPPLITFAKTRKQITTIPIKVLQSPINKTDDNLRIEDYLVGHISAAKLGNLSNVILYETVFDHCKIKKTEKMKRARTKDRIIEYLTHYKQCKFIKDFTADKKGVTLVFAGKKADSKG